MPGEVMLTLPQPLALALVLAGPVVLWCAWSVWSDVLGRQARRREALLEAQAHERLRERQARGACPPQ